MSVGFLQRFKSKLSSFLEDYWEVVLIYPALFVYIFSNDINLINLQSLVYRKLCLNEYNEVICDSLRNYTNASNNVQEMTSEKMIYMNVAFLIPAIVAIVHMASIADRRLNYEIPLIVSLAGSLAQSLICIFSVDLPYSLSYGLLILSQIVNGICGAGSLSFISSCFSHVATYENGHKSKAQPDMDPKPQVKTHRSVRYSICESCLLLGQFLGSFSSGYLIGNKLNLFNYKRVYIISFAMYLFVLIYVIVMFRYLKFRKQTMYNSLMSLNTGAMLESGQASTNSSGIKIDLIVPQRKCSPGDFLRNQTKFISETWQLLSKPREKNARVHINSLLILFFLGSSISMGIMSLQYLYVSKKPISLNQVDYGLYKALNTLCRAAALLIILPILKYFSAPDYVLFLLGLTSEFLNLVVFIVSHWVSSLIWFG